MKTLHKKPYQFQFTHPPKALLKAKLDNIAIVPASMLAFQNTIQHIRNSLPQGAVFLCYIKENARQRKVLEQVEAVLKQHGHAVRSLSMEQAVQM